MFIKAFKSGSRNLLNPPILNTDDDIIALVSDLQETNDKLLSDGYEKSEGYDHYGKYAFESYRKGELNLLITSNLKIFNGALIASYLTKKYNITEKIDRVTLFKAFRQEIDLEENWSSLISLGDLVEVKEF